MPKVPLQHLSPYQQHLNEWKDCTRCKLHSTRKRMVFYKGKIPCDILFIGEAPGMSEDCIGIPFDGPAGNLLAQMVKRAIPEKYRLCFGNMLACIPVDDTGRKATEPEDECVEACTPRISQIIAIASPRVLVAIGKLPGNWLTPGYRWSVQRDRSVPLHVIVHPRSYPTE